MAAMLPVQQQQQQQLNLNNGAAQIQHLQHSSKSLPELELKYNRLKRKYFEMEARMKDERREKEDSQVHLVRMKAERSAMLERIAQLESQMGPQGYDPARSSAFPAVAPLVPSAQLLPHLQSTLDADDSTEMPEEPRLKSRHIANSAGEPFPTKPDPDMVIPNPKPLNNATPAPPAAAPSKRKAPKNGPKKSESTPAPPEPAPATASSSGTRLRIKPPVPPQDAAPPAAGAHSMGLPPAHHEATSPISPVHNRMQGSNTQQTSPGAPPGSAHTASSPPPSNGRPASRNNSSVLRTRNGSSSASQPSALQRSTKPKRLKAHTVTARTSSVPVIPRDDAGKPDLPLTIGLIKVVNLGEVCMREHFHTERYIFPVGYEITRRYLSSTDPNKEVTYRCKILEGPSGPIFQIMAEDIDLIEAGTATGAWSGIVKTANQIRNRQHSNSVSGPDYFGLGHNTIRHMIQELPGAKDLRDYVWQNYVEGGPMGGRHAAIVTHGGSAVSDSMDVDQDESLVPEGDQSYNIEEGLGLGSGSSIVGSGSKPSTPVIVAPTNAKDAESSERHARSHSAHSPHQRGIPSSMASLLNSYPEDDADMRSRTPPAVDSGSTYSKRRLASVARDSVGRPLLPLEVPSTVLHNLGRISKHDEYHNSRFIYPIGYEAERHWLSATDRDRMTDYNCQILEGANGPVFQVVAKDQPYRVVKKATASEAWEEFSRDARAIRHQPPHPMDQGEEYFGLGNSTIRALIQELPAARDLRHYVWGDVDGN